MHLLVSDLLELAVGVAGPLWNPPRVAVVAVTPDHVSVQRERFVGAQAPASRAEVDDRGGRMPGTGVVPVVRSGPYWPSRLACRRIRDGPHPTIFRNGITTARTGAGPRIGREEENPTTSPATSAHVDMRQPPNGGESIRGIAYLTDGDRDARGGTFLFARFRAPNYPQMKRAFDDLQELLQRHGARGHRIFRLADDPQDHIIIVEFASHGGARGFTREPQLARAIEAAGVEGGAHHIQYVEEFRDQLEVVDYPQ
jgi:hypothetical protein